MWAYAYYECYMCRACYHTVIVAIVLTGAPSVSVVAVRAVAEAVLEERAGDAAEVASRVEHTHRQ